MPPCPEQRLARYNPSRDLSLSLSGNPLVNSSPAAVPAIWSISGSVASWPHADGGGQIYVAAAGRGLRVIVAGAGGAAHLPGMLAAQTHLPVLGVPVESSLLRGVDSLLSIVQMPAGVPVGTLAIGPAGAANAALLAVSILALDDPLLRERLVSFRAAQTDRVLGERLETEAAAWSDLPSEK